MMRNWTAWGKRLLALALVLTFWPVVRAQGASESGTVRVYLSSLSSLSTLDLTIAGSYSVNGDTSRSFARGDQVTVRCSGRCAPCSRGARTNSEPESEFHRWKEYCRLRKR